MFFEQLFFTGNEAILNNIKLNFNHPIKELVWDIPKKRFKNSRKYVNFIYYENFKDYEEKHYKENANENFQYILKNMQGYRIFLATDYLNLNYNIRFGDMNDSIIYKKENKLYTDNKIINILHNMNLINKDILDFIDRDCIDLFKKHEKTKHHIWFK